MLATTWLTQDVYRDTSSSAPPMPSSANCEQPRYPDRISRQEREREMSPGRQLPRQMQPRHQIADGNQRICNVQLLLSRICNLCRAQIVTHNRGQEHSGFLGGALWPKCGLFYLSFSCSRQYAALVQNKIFSKILKILKILSIFFRISLEYPECSEY